MVHVVGAAAEQQPKVGDKVQGITVQRKAAEAMRVMTPEDLGVYNKVSVGQIIQRQHMALTTKFSKCRLALEVMFEGIDAEQAMGGVEGSGSGVPLALAACAGYMRIHAADVRIRFLNPAGACQHMRSLPK